MCLAVPGQLIKIIHDDDSNALTRRGVVDFGGVRKEVSLALLPEAGIGDYVLVHVGFAMSRIDAKQAERVFSYLDEIGATEATVEATVDATDAASQDSSPAGTSTKANP